MPLPCKIIVKENPVELSSAGMDIIRKAVLRNFLVKAPIELEHIHPMSSTLPHAKGGSDGG